MPDIQAFRALRYDLGHVGSLSDVVAPPYDVIDRALQESLYKRHPANVIRLILNRAEPGDEDDDARYRRAAGYLKNWRSEGVLAADSQPALYVYHQTFSHGDATITRRGFLCRVRLERFGEGNIYPHEETHAGPKADRLKLTTACKANLSPIFGIYPDAENGAQELLEQEVVGTTPLEATDHLGVVHRMWPVANLETIASVEKLLGPKPLYIADGHHRYETACNYRDRLAAEGELPPMHPAHSVLAMCVSMSDSGMIVLPTHRLFRQIPELSSAELESKLAGAFQTDIAGEGAALANDLWTEMELAGQQGNFAFYCPRDDKWVMARITDDGLARMAELYPSRSVPWRSLGVSILHGLVIDALLGAKGHPAPRYVHSVEEVVEGLTKGDSAERDAAGMSGQGKRFALAALVMPATLEHIRLVSQHMERMPAKSTYFYPKLLSGLVINPLE